MPQPLVGHGQEQEVVGTVVIRMGFTGFVFLIGKRVGLVSGASLLKLAACLLVAARTVKCGATEKTIAPGLGRLRPYLIGHRDDALRPGNGVRKDDTGPRGPEAGLP